MLNRRQEQLIKLLTEKKEWMTSRELAGYFRVTDRTIRSDVDAVNRQGDHPLVESNVRKGYRALPVAGQEPKPAQNQGMPQTPGTRCIYIIQKLLLENRELNLTELQGQIYVSDSSIQNDLKRIRRMIEPYPGLRLVRSRECISLQGDEISKRRFYRELLVAEVQENFLNLNRLAHLYRHFDLIEVKDIFVKVLEEYDYSIHESLFSMLILHAGTSIERIRTCHYIQPEEEQQGLKDTIEYQISRTFFERISGRLHLEIQEGEISMFALVIMGRRASNYASDHIRLGDRWLNIRRLMEEALARLKEVFGVDFAGDEDLAAGLKIHLHGLVERVKNQVLLEDIFLEEIKQKYPLVFEMGVCIVSYLEEQLQTRIGDMESGFIALHLGAASERMNSVRKHRAVMIMPHNQVFSGMCEKRILELYRERMEIVRKCSYFEEEEIRLLDPDLVLTTFPIEHRLDIPTVSISPFVDPETEANILQALNRLDKKRFRLEFTSHMGHLIRKEHYYPDLNARTPKEVIRCLCRGLEKEGIVDEHFQDIVLERERMTPTSFANALAIPHAFRAYASRSTIAVAQLQNPVQWGAFEVRLVMLFAINEGDQRMIKIFFDWVSDIVSRPEELAKLTERCSYEEFTERVME